MMIRYTLLVVVLLSVLLSSFALAQDDSMARSMFEGFMAKYNRNYASAQEKEARFQIFQQNLLKAKQLQSVQTGSAVYGFNKFSDLTEAEFRSSHLLRKFPSATVCKWPYSRYLVDFDGLTQAAPSSFDWRTKGAVTEVKNQESCGSCWSFSTVANIEGQMFLSTKTLTSYSEQQIVDCSHACLQSESYLCNAGCGGGLPWLAYEDIMTWSKGLVTETSYPYVGVDQACQSVTVSSPGHISNWTAVPTTVSVINTFLVSNGPLSITLNADLLFSYTKGVINTDPSQCDPEGADHAVTLVGYGVDESTKTNYWIVKNSWGEDWGEEGYFRIASDQGLCGINACVTSSLIKH